jgi:hypothetical protein
MTVFAATSASHCARPLRPAVDPEASFPMARFGRALNRGGSQGDTDATRVAGDEPAGQRAVSSHERRCPQTIALTLSSISVFPMTHHVECVGVLVPTTG